MGAIVEVYEFGAATGKLLCKRMPPLAKQVLNSTSTSTSGAGQATSSAFNRSTVLITAISTTDWRAAIGVTPTTATPHVFVPASVYFDAEVTAGHKIIALSATAT